MNKFLHTKDTQSRRVRIVAPIRKEFQTFKCKKKKKMSPVTFHLSPVTCHLSPVACRLSPVACHLSSVTCHLSPVRDPIVNVRAGIRRLLDRSRVEEDQTARIFGSEFSRRLLGYTGENSQA